MAKLVELHLRFHGYGDGEWTDSAVRRYVRDAGPLLERLHILTRADCTTRNKRKAERLARTYDELEARISRLAEEEELASMRPDLDGSQIMKILGIEPGPLVGQAYRFLLERRIDEGPLGEERAEAELLAWWQVQPSSQVARPPAPVELLETRISMCLINDRSAESPGLVTIRSVAAWPARSCDSAVV